MTERCNWHVWSVEEFSSVRAIWDELNEHSGSLPVLDSRFVGQLLRYFPIERGCLALLEVGGVPHSMCLLERKRFGVWNTYQPSQAPLGAWLSRSRSLDPSELRLLMSELDGLGLVLGLSQLDPCFNDRPSEGRYLRTMDYIETACLATSGDFDKYWMSRGKNLRQNNRKQRNRLEKAGIEVRLELVRDQAKIGRCVEEFGLLESAGWKAEKGTAVHAENAQGQFYRALLEEFAGSGEARVYRYCFDGDPVAIDLCLAANGVLIILKTTYSEEHSRYSPGMLMREEQIRQLFEDHDITSIEFYGRALDWHRRLTDDIRTLFHCTAYRFRAAKRVVEIKSSLGGR